MFSFMAQLNTTCLYGEARFRGSSTTHEHSSIHEKKCSNQRGSSNYKKIMPHLHHPHTHSIIARVLCYIARQHKKLLLLEQSITGNFYHSSSERI
jgi:hypothetical protein